MSIPPYDVALARHDTSYFHAPEATLDPALFDGTHLRPDVREWILDTVYGFLNSRYNDAESWARVWLAGSGASYQWSAAREPGDLDLLLGLNYVQFRRANPAFAGSSDVEIAGMLNDEMYADLYPRIAEVEF